MQVIKYTPDLERRLRNVGSLPHGTGAKYLVCIAGQGDELVAKQWARTLPTGSQDIIIKFGK